jgi:hypothetical protein
MCLYKVLLLLPDVALPHPQTTAVCALPSAAFRYESVRNVILLFSLLYLSIRHSAIFTLKFFKIIYAFSLLS